jgi:hypothetical protein
MVIIELYETEVNLGEQNRNLLVYIIIFVIMGAIITSRIPAPEPSSSMQLQELAEAIRANEVQAISLSGDEVSVERPTAWLNNWLCMGYRQRSWRRSNSKSFRQAIMTI